MGPWAIHIGIGKQTSTAVGPPQFGGYRNIENFLARLTEARHLIALKTAVVVAAHLGRVAAVAALISEHGTQDRLLIRCPHRLILARATFQDYISLIYLVDIDPEFTLL